MPKRILGALLPLLFFCGPGPSQERLDPERAIALYEIEVQRVRSFDVTVAATMRIRMGTEQVAPAGKNEDGTPRLPQLKLRKLRPGEEPQIRKEFSRQVYRQGKGRIELLDGPGGKPKQIVAYDN